jgi:hypothetical protein
MANVFATKNGNWSDTTVWNTGALPTSADDVYANNFRVVVDISATVLSIRHSATTGVVAGGGFDLTNGVVLTAGGFVGFTNTILIKFDLPSLNTATIIGNVFPPSGVDGAPTVSHTGAGTLNFIGDIFSISRSGCSGILISGIGILNVTGNLISTTNVPNTATQIRITGNATVNVTGDLIWQTIQINSNSPLIVITSAGTLNLIGTVNGGGSYGIQSSGASLINIIGPIVGGVVVAGTVGSPALNTTNGSSVTILTGPFISHVSGIQPFIVVRMHYRRTLGSYYEFRDNSTNGALPPSPPAPATRLVSPDTVADSPIPRDVRLGTIYAEGSQTGTMIVPSRDNVAKGVLVDNTTGTAILDADSIWAVPLTSVNTLNSIGRRVKNAATVETTGAQIQQTLNDNE